MPERLFALYCKLIEIKGKTWICRRTADFHDPCVQDIAHHQGMYFPVPEGAGAILFIQDLPVEKHCREINIRRCFSSAQAKNC
jgi:hypothetical protein